MGIVAAIVALVLVAEVVLYHRQAALEALEIERHESDGLGQRVDS